MRVETVRWIAVDSAKPGPMTIMAVMTTLIEATSRRCRNLEAVRERTTTTKTVETPNPRKCTAIRAIPTPMVVPSNWPKPSRIDLFNEIRTESVAAIAATSPPLSTKWFPAIQAIEAAAAVTRTRWIQALRFATGSMNFAHRSFITPLSS